MAPSRPPKRLRKIVAAAEALGWTYDTTKTGHPRLNPPRGQRDATGALQAPVTFALTPSDSQRGDRNAVSALRRAGVPIK